MLMHKDRPAKFWYASLTNIRHSCHSTNEPQQMEQRIQFHSRQHQTSLAPSIVLVLTVAQVRKVVLQSVMV